MNGPPDPNHGSNRNSYRYPVGSGRTRTHGRLFSNLKRIPGIENVHREQSGTGIDHEIVGDIETMIFAAGVIPHEEAHISYPRLKSWVCVPQGQPKAAIQLSVVLVRKPREGVPVSVWSRQSPTSAPTDHDAFHERTPRGRLRSNGVDAHLPSWKYQPFSPRILSGVDALPPTTTVVTFRAVIL